MKWLILILLTTALASCSSSPSWEVGVSADSWREAERVCASFGGPAFVRQADMNDHRGAGRTAYLVKVGWYIVARCTDGQEVRSAIRTVEKQ